MVIVLVTLPFRTCSRKTNLSAWLGQEGAGPVTAAGAGGLGAVLPVPQFPHPRDAGGRSAESPVRAVLLTRSSLAEAKLRKRSAGSV